jgi:hypothetical protein
MISRSPVAFIPQKDKTCKKAQNKMRSILALALAALPVAVVAQCPPLVFIFGRKLYLG